MQTPKHVDSKLAIRIAKSFESMLILFKIVLYMSGHDAYTSN